MNNLTQLPKRLTREKHLDHLVKVVPFIAFMYGVQGYTILKFKPMDLSINGVLFLGICLVSMIAGFITYDLQQCVEVHEDHLKFHFIFPKLAKTIYYHEIQKIEISAAEDPFGTLKIHDKKGKQYQFFFLDDVKYIKTLIETQSTPSQQLAA